MNRPILSIILPIYNAEEYLEECLESVIKLRDYNYELVVIDDGSTDNSADIVKKYIDEGNNIRLFSKENSGPSDSRNLGIINSKGEYITFLDADDYYIYPECLFDIISRMKKEDCQIGCFNFNRVDNHGKKPEKYTSTSSEKFAVRMLSDKVTTAKGIEFSNGIGVTLWNKIFKSDLFDKVKFPKGIQLMDDLKVCYDAAAISNKVLLCDGVIYYYRKHYGSITLSGFSAKNYDLVNVPEAVMKETEERYGKLSERMKPGLAVIYLSFINRLYSSKNRDKEYEKKIKNYILSNFKIIVLSKDITLFHKFALLAYGLLPAMYRIMMQCGFKNIMKLRYRKG